MLVCVSSTSVKSGLAKRLVNAWPFKQGIVHYTKFLHVLEKTSCLQLFLPLYDRDRMFLLVYRFYMLPAGRYCVRFTSMCWRCRECFNQRWCKWPLIGFTINRQTANIFTGPSLISNFICSRCLWNVIFDKRPNDYLITAPAGRSPRSNRFV